MASFNKFQDFVEQLAKGVHQLHAAGHTLKVYLSNEAPLATDTVKADIVEITAQNGRYGPYLKKGTDSRSLETEEQLFDVTLQQAEEIFAQPKQRRGAARAAAAPLKELGTDPASGAPVVVKDGRFGPYVTDGTTNATLRKGDEIDSLSPERAYELLAEKRAKGPAPKRGGARKPAARTARGTARRTGSGS